MKIKKLSECTLEEALTAWNKGFEDYLVPVKMDIHTFVSRMVHEDLLPEKSVVAFMHGEPCGIIMTGIREINGRKIAWNGGTGIAPEYRGKGLSAALMVEVLGIYKGEKARAAVLEAIEENERAIKLYKKMGYDITDHLLYLNKKISKKEKNNFIKNNFQIKKVYPEQLQYVSFYNADAAWQSQWQSVKNGEGAVFFSPDGHEAGYILFKRVLDRVGRTNRIIIYQLSFRENYSINETMIESILGNMFFENDDAIDFTAINISAANPVSQTMLKMGFEKKIGQVMMKKDLLHTI